MKRTGLYPKCGSENLLLVSGKAGAYESRNNIMIGHNIFSAVLVNRYVCRTCDFTEEWVDLENVPKLGEKYDRQKEALKEVSRNGVRRRDGFVYSTNGKQVKNHGFLAGEDAT